MLDFLKDPQRVFQENKKLMSKRRAQSFTSRITKQRRSPRRLPIETPIDRKSKEIIDIEITRDTIKEGKTDSKETKKDQKPKREIVASLATYAASENESNAVCSNTY